MNPSNRIYTDVENGQRCRLYTSNDASKYHLIYEGQPEQIADGCEVNGFYIAAHTGAMIKTNKGKQIYVNMGQFYNLKEGEQVTHRKFTVMDKFVKI